MTTPLPANPSLEQLKNLAKDLVRRFAAGDSGAMLRVREHLPRAATLPANGSRITLAEAQLVVAREHGHPSWPRLRKHILGLRGDPAAITQAFVHAVRSGDTPKLRTLLNKHPELSAQIGAPLFDFDSPAVVCAASRADREMLRLLLEHGADINARSKWWAGGFGVLPHSDPGFADFLTELGAVVDVWAAAGMNRLERLTQLLDGDPMLLNARGGDGQGPLHFAASVEIARLLLDRGAEMEMRDIDHGSTPAQHMAADRPEVCRYLLSRGARSDLFMAVQIDDLDLVKRIVTANPKSMYTSVNSGALTSGESNGMHIYTYTLSTGQSPLLLAADLGRDAIYRFLLERSTPGDRLVAACIRADRAAVEQAIAAQPDIVRSLSPQQMRRISDAAWRHKTDAVRLMIEIGFDIEARGEDDSSALNRAAVRGYGDTIDVLLAAGASMESKNAFGGTPLSACVWGAENFRDPEGDYPASLKRMLATNPPVTNVPYPSDNRQVSALLRRYLEKLQNGGNIIAAIKLGDALTVASLLDSDSGRVNTRTSGRLPLYEAIRLASVDIVRVLIQHGADPGLSQEPGGPTLLEEAAQNDLAHEVASLAQAH